MEATNTPDTLAERLRTLPKVELHNHLEGGSMYPDLAIRLAARNGMTLPFHDAPSAAEYYRFTSLDQFIDILRTTVATLNTAEDYADAVERQGIEARRQNIRYHELFVTYGLVSGRGVPWEAVVEGLVEGRRRNAEVHGVDTAFIIDLDRTLPANEALRHVELALAAPAETGIVGLGLDCQEAGFPAGRLRHCFAAAAEAGLPLTAHAGEDGGAASVRDALDCGVSRIDHGVQAVEDPALLAELAERQVLLTVCPLSNVALRVFPSLAEHSLPQLIEAGIPVCLNSDDPPMFASDLLTECLAVEAQFGFGEAALVGMLRNAVVHSFQAPAAKARLLADFDAAAAQLGNESGHVHG